MRMTSKTGLQSPFNWRQACSIVRWRGAAAVAAALVLVTACGGDGTDETVQEQKWLGTWYAAPTGPADTANVAAALPSISFKDQTLRMIVRTSVAGKTIRIRLSNEIGRTPLPVTIGAAHVALRGSGAGIAAGTDRVLTFGGQKSVTIAPGTPILSDPIELDVPALTDLAVSLYLPGTVVGQTLHAVSRQTQYVSTAGDHTADAVLPIDASRAAFGNPYWHFLSGVEVSAPKSSGAIVALGDSITDGFGDATLRVDGPAAWPSWPSRLAERLQADASSSQLSVLNAGISGNRLLSDAAGDNLSTIAAALQAGALRANLVYGPKALARFDRDVLARPGATCVVVFEGINDIGQGPIFGPVVSADQVIAGYKQLIARAKEAGLAAIGGTLTPIIGFTSPGYATADTEATRQAVNTWIRTSGAYDAVIDFDAAVRDPAAKDRLLAAYDSGDHLHPSDAGYKVMADAADLATLRRLCLR
jgi:lysophospholipase L1-like esterase